jgi:hypothetical protein
LVNAYRQIVAATAAEIAGGVQSLRVQSGNPPLR